MMTAKDIMRSRVLTLTPGQTLREAAALFAKHRISGAPVVGPKKALLGVLSQTDFVRRADERAKGIEPAFYYEGATLQIAQQPAALLDLPVKQVMTPVTLAVEPSEPVSEIARLMLLKRVHRVVVAEDGALRGVVSSLDVIRGLLDALA